MSNSLIDKMKERGVINPQDEEIYAYGIEIIKLKLTAGIIAFVIGLLLDTVLFLACFLAVLIPIRKYAGGAHASSKGACLCITELIMLSTEIIYRYIEVNDICMIVFVVVGMVTIFCKSPYYSVNHPLTYKQIKKYRLISICFSIGFALFFTVAYVEEWNLIKYAISTAFCAESILLVIPTSDGRYST